MNLHGETNEKIEKFFKDAPQLVDDQSLLIISVNTDVILRA